MKEDMQRLELEEHDHVRGDAAGTLYPAKLLLQAFSQVKHKPWICSSGERRGFEPLLWASFSSRVVTFMFDLNCELMNGPWKHVTVR